MKILLDNLPNWFCSRNNPLVFESGKKVYKAICPYCNALLKEDQDLREDFINAFCPEHGAISQHAIVLILTSELNHIEEANRRIK